MPKYAGINSASRMQRAMQESPIPDMIADLATGKITPVWSTAELRMRYRKDRLSEAEAKTCMTHACRAHAAASGSVLVVTDDAGKICFGYVPDPGLETDDPEMAAAFEQLGKMIDAGHAASIVAARPTSDTSTSVECPVFAMPAFEYKRAHGQAVEAYGTYLISFRITVPSAASEDRPCPMKVGCLCGGNCGSSEMWGQIQVDERPDYLTARVFAEMTGGWLQPPRSHHA